MSMQNGKPLVLLNFYGALKSDGHGNGGTLINGNGGTYYHNYVYIQARGNHSTLYTGGLHQFIYLNIFWKQWNTFSLVSMVLFEV